MDAFVDGKFPLGTFCGSEQKDRAFCVNGRCVRFDATGFPIVASFDEFQFVRNQLKDTLHFRNRHRRSASSLVKSPTSRLNYQRLVHSPRLEPLSAYENGNSTSRILRVQPWTWRVSLGECSVPCGGGERNVTIICQSGHHEVDHHLCPKESKPDWSLLSSCNRHPCLGR